MKIKNAFVQSPAVSAVLPFYEKVLGLRPQFVDGDRWAQFKVDGVTIALAGESESVADTQGWVLTFEVPDLEAVVAVVEASGGVVLERRDMGDHGRSVIVRDPAGNVTALWAQA
jgi:predicted enzyme related to lactoylglutathione lyase